MKSSNESSARMTHWRLLFSKSCCCFNYKKNVASFLKHHFVVVVIDPFGLVSISLLRLIVFVSTMIRSWYTTHTIAIVYTSVHEMNVHFMVIVIRRIAIGIQYYSVPFSTTNRRKSADCISYSFYECVHFVVSIRYDTQTHSLVKLQLNSI